MRLLKQGLYVVSTSLFLTQVSWADSLKDIYETALQNDPVLSAARASFNADRETKNISRAALLPQLSVSGDYTESENNENSQQIVVIQNEPIPSIRNGLTDSTQTRYSASLTQAIFDMPSWYRFRGGSNLSESARAQFSADQQSLIIRVSQAYFNALRAHDNMETRKAEERAIQRQLEQTRERFEVGLLPVTDVHEAQAVFDDAAVNSLEARGALNIAFEALEVLTGQSHSVLAGLMDNFQATNPRQRSVKAGLIWPWPITFS